MNPTNSSVGTITQAAANGRCTPRACAAHAAARTFPAVLSAIQPPELDLRTRILLQAPHDVESVLRTSPSEPRSDQAHSDRHHRDDREQERKPNQRAIDTQREREQEGHHGRARDTHCHRDAHRREHRAIGPHRPRQQCHPDDLTGLSRS